LDLFLELPWNVYSKDNFDLKRAEKILDRSFFRRGEEKNDRAFSSFKIAK
jgi:ATP-dependent Lon protease